MFKNATLLRLARDAQQALDLTTVEFDAMSHRHQPIGETQTKSVGWVPPREPNAPFVEVIGGQWIMAALVETRTVPASAVDKRVTELAAKIEQETGRKPGKKQRAELKDAVTLELLPRAFPKAVCVLVWLDPDTGLLAMDTASRSVADDVGTLLAATIAGRWLPVNTTKAPISVMTRWVHDGETDSDAFDIGAACELHATDESEATVSYTNTDLSSPDVRGHVAAGKVAVQLSLAWQERAFFSLTDGLVLKKLEVMGDTTATPPASAASEFDADVALFTGEMRPLLSALLNELGGLQLDENEAALA